MTTLTIELPEEIFATLRQSPREVARELRVVAAVDWYRRGVVSQGRGAEIAGMTRADFIDELARRKVEVSQIDLDQLDQEISIV